VWVFIFVYLLKELRKGKISIIKKVRTIIYVAQFAHCFLKKKLLQRNISCRWTPECELFTRRKKLSTNSFLAFCSIKPPSILVTSLVRCINMLKIVYLKSCSINKNRSVSNLKKEFVTHLFVLFNIEFSK